MKIESDDEHNYLKRVTTALSAAIQINEIEMVKILVSGGANVDNRNHIGLTEYGLARRLGFTEIYEYLLEQHTLNEVDCLLNNINILHKGPIFLGKSLQLFLSDNDFFNKSYESIWCILVELFCGKEDIEVKTLVDTFLNSQEVNEIFGGFLARQVDAQKFPSDDGEGVTPKT